MTRALTPLFALPLFLACGDEPEPIDTGDDPVLGCPAQDGAGTRHAGALTASETWRAEDGPHYVDETVLVPDGVTLEIEGCSEVRLAGGKGIELGDSWGGAAGRLVVAGESERAVRFVRSAEGAAWGNITVYPGATAELRHVDLVGGGGDDTRQGATLVMLGDYTLGGEGSVAIEELRIEDSKGLGVLMEGAARFAEGSTGLTVTGSGDSSWPYPVVLGQHSLDTLPDGNLRGNEVDAVRVLEDLANGYNGLQRDATMRALSVPYVVGGDWGEPFLVGGTDGSLATLTIEAGVELRFQPNTGLRVLSPGGQPGGTLVAQGTADAPVVFTSNSATPQPGDWSNLWFETPMDGRTLLSHVEIAYAGGWCSCSLTSCSPVDSYDAAVVIEGVPQGVFIEDSVIRASAGHGVLRSWLDHEEYDFSENTFEDLAGCDQTWPQLSDEVCPDVAYACSND